ncbi:DoxX family protein [uncultured Brevundimonas sp.]|uniref:DoxX family protein n=1 Tax=uncultured Brevundimonas sp. TaxID=213418 RepID=UPI0025DFBA7D|nr:DoxX family protein [uncultured Brevundimonas sp.]
MSLSHLPLDRTSRWPAAARSAATARTVDVERRRSHYRNMTLWTLQGWLAMFFIAAGYAKLTRPMELLVLLLGWPVAGMERLLIVIGVAEILLAIGVLAPLVSWRVGRPVLMAPPWWACWGSPASWRRCTPRVLRRGSPSST